ncbi:MAG TPA: ABC transporter ATP-binding protein, partial [Halomonas sp.]|nr:ABC transporter ATP-binding protein [Halomonas sp.]
PAPAAEPTKKAVKLSYKLQRELDALPAEIERLEGDVETLEQEIGDPAFYQQEATAVTAKLQALEKVQQALEVAMERWMELEAMANGE